MDKTLYEEICRKLEGDLEEGLEFCQNLLCGTEFPSFEAFLNQKKKKIHSSICSNAWTESQGYIVLCKDCRMYKTSCICLQCFLEGNHYEHDFSISTSTTGNCDCGDLYFWKESGTCIRHKKCNENKEINFITPEMRTLYITIFSAAIQGLKLTPALDQKELRFLLSWLSLFTSLGDEVRQCISIAFRDSFDIENLLLHIPYFHEDSVQYLFRYFGSLINEDVFRFYMNNAILRLYPKLLWMFIKSASYNLTNSFPRSPYTQMLVIMDFSFHAFSIPSVQYSIDHGLNWVKMIIDSINLIFDISMQNMVLHYFDLIKLAAMNSHMHTILAIIKKIPNHQIEIAQFIQQISFTFAKIEGVVSFSRQFETAINHNPVHSCYFFLQDSAMQLINDIYNFKMYVPALFAHFCAYLDQILIQDQYDEIEDESIPFFRSTMTPGVKVTTGLSLHVLAFVTLMARSNKLVETFNEIADSNSIVNDDLATYWALLPMRFMAVLYQSAFKCFNKSDEFILKSLRYHTQKNTNLIKIVPLFSLIQTMLGLTTQKDTFMATITHTFGIFLDHSIEGPSENQITRNTEFIFLYFVSCLIFDRSCLTRDFVTMRRLHAITLLFKKDRTAKELKQKWNESSKYTKIFFEDIHNYTSQDNIGENQRFRLTDRSEWHPILPWIKIGKIYRFLSSIVSERPHMIIPFPDFEPEPYNLKLSPALHSRFLYAVIYRVLSNSFHDKQKIAFTSFHLVLALLIRGSQIPETEPEDKTINMKIAAPDIQSLCDMLPNNFNQFICIQINYMERGPSSVIDFLYSSKELGEAALSRMNIDPAIKPHPNFYRSAQFAHQYAQNLQTQITKKYYYQAQCYGLYVPFRETMCAICHLNKKGFLVYPALCYQTVIPLIVNGVKSEDKTVSIKIYPRPIHSTCIDITNGSTCPEDSVYRNAHLPVVDQKFTKFYNEPLTQAINLFIHKVFNIHEPFENATRCFIGELCLIEARQRVRADVLDSPEVSILLDNLFQVIWQGVKFGNLELKGNICFNDPDSVLFLLVVQLDDPSSNYIANVNLVSGPLKARPDNLFIFLRRCLIFEHFALHNKVGEGFIEWDEVLSFNSLLKHYEMGESNLLIDISPIHFIDLPHSIYAFLKPPHSINVLDINAGLAICLITGQVVCLPQSNTRQYPTIKQHLDTNFQSTFSVFMCITGTRLGQTFIQSIEYNMKQNCGHIYLDKYGQEPDDSEQAKQTYSRTNKENMFLSEVRLNRLKEFILSGNWTNFIKRL